MWTWDVIRRIIEIFWLFDVVLAGWTVFRSKRNIVSVWAWLLVLILIPYLGFILYLFLGRQLSHDDIFAIQEEQRKLRDAFLTKQKALIEQHDLLPAKDRHPRARQLAELNLNNDNAILTFNNHIQIFIDGPQLFTDLTHRINKARQVIDIEFYTFYSDHLGQRILKALEKAAKRGVQVKVIYDSAGSRGTKASFFNNLRKLGGQAQPFISSSSKHFFNTPRANYHLHRKLVIIDHCIGYIGGFNIGDQYVDRSPKFGHWRDTHLRVNGQAAIMMETRFAMDWNTSCRRSHLPQYNLRPLRNFKLEGPDNAPSSVATQIVASGPDNQKYGIRRGYEGIIATARHYIYIQTPYLIPEESILESLIIAAKSGIDVRIIIPAMPDHPFVYRATEYYAKLLTQNGIKVYKYNNGFIHAKTMVSGANICSVGSANQDYRSYTLNFEVNAFNYSPALALKLKEIFEQDLASCTLLTPQYFAQQSPWHKFKEQFSRLLSPIL